MTFRLLLILAVATVSCGTTSAVEPIDVGSRLELFVDDYLIETISGARRTLNQPTPRELVMVHDEPWEGNISACHTVFQDGDLYRMYYRGAQYDLDDEKIVHQVTCYAESRDGIHWSKPDLGLAEFQGSKKNNIILSVEDSKRTGQSGHNFAPFKDANPACKPDEKYKAVGGLSGMYAFKSPDGLRWSPMVPDRVVTKGAFDSQNLAFWDSVRGRYVEYHRGFRNGVRDVMTSTSPDFLHWSEPVWLEFPGAPIEHVYTTQIAPYYRAPHVFMGFPKRFTPSRRAVEHRYPGVSDGIFMTSRDGLRFKRWGEAFIRPGPQQDRWVPRNNLTAWGMLVTKSDIPGAPDELSLYSTEHYYFNETDGTRLRRFTIRIDGFVSVWAPLAGGELLTKPILFGGKELAVNFSTSAAGSLRVEIQTAGGEPIEGFTLADCEEIFGDQLERIVSWKGGSDVGPLAGRPVRLRFVLKDADLYSLRFQ